MLTESHPAGAIVPELEPRKGEFIVRKTEPSAFFGTGLAPWLVRDCVGDRALGPHEANLFDMGQKYADIADRDEIISALEKR